MLHMSDSLRSISTALARAQLLFFFRQVLPGTFAIGPGATVGVIFVCMLLQSFSYLLFNEKIWGFNPSGVNSLFAGWAVIAVLLIILKTRDRYIDVWELLTAIAVCAFWGTAAFCLTAALFATNESSSETGQMQITDLLALAIWLAVFIWQIAAIYWAGRQLGQFGVRRFGARAVLASLLVLFIVPQEEIFYSSSPNPMQGITVWHWIDDWVDSAVAHKQDAAKSQSTHRVDYEYVLDRQRPLVANHLSKVTENDTSKPEFYFVGLGAYAHQAVFTREVQATKELFDDRFATKSHSIILNNNRDTVEQFPLASVTNLRKVLGGLAKKMDPENDVLVLFMTSHGSPGVLSVDFYPMPLNDLKAKDLAEALDESGIKNRVVIVSSCHSGSFIPELKNENSAILTASRSDRSSFGCSNEREWTYFGDALVNRALRGTFLFDAAFRDASALVKEWEEKNGLTPSEPQMSIGSAIAPRLDALAKSLEKKMAESASR